MKKTMLSAVVLSSLFTFGCFVTQQSSDEIMEKKTEQSTREVP